MTYQPKTEALARLKTAVDAYKGRTTTDQEERDHLDWIMQILTDDVPPEFFYKFDGDHPPARAALGGGDE